QKIGGFVSSLRPVSRPAFLFETRPVSGAAEERPDCRDDRSSERCLNYVRHDERNDAELPCGLSTDQDRQPGKAGSKDGRDSSNHDGEQTERLVAPTTVSRPANHRG